jgi:uncharacterized protein (TIGR01244 family)
LRKISPGAHLAVQETAAKAGSTMTDFKRVTDRFSVAPQIQVADLARAAGLGFGAVICNRPDGEDFGQPRTADIRAAAEAAGLRFIHAPFQGPPTHDAIETVTNLLADQDKPVLAFCRSGTRSVTAWAIGAARSGALAPDAILTAARGAGYDLSPLKDLLHTHEGG